MGSTVEQVCAQWRPVPTAQVWYDGRPLRLLYELVIGVWMEAPDEAIWMAEAPDEAIWIAESKPCNLHGPG